MEEEVAAPEKEVRNEGQRLLLEVTRTTTQEQIANVVGCTRPNVSYWVNGKGLPGSAARKILAAKYGIHVNAWGRAPGSSSAPSSTQPSGEVADTSTLDLLNQRIKQWGDVAGDEANDVDVRMRAGELERKCIDSRRSLERDARAREADIVARSPEWADIRRRTLSVLREFPDALRAWCEALGALAAEQAPPPDEEDES